MLDNERARDAYRYHSDALDVQKEQKLEVATVKSTGTYEYTGAFKECTHSLQDLWAILGGIIFAGFAIGMHALFTCAYTMPEGEEWKIVLVHIFSGIFLLAGIALVCSAIRSVIKINSRKSLSKHHGYETEFYRMLDAWTKEKPIVDETLLERSFISCARIIKVNEDGFVAETEPIQNRLFFVYAVYKNPPAINYKVGDIIHFCGRVDRVLLIGNTGSSDNYRYANKLIYRILDVNYLNARGWDWRNMQLKLTEGFGDD